MAGRISAGRASAKVEPGAKTMSAIVATMNFFNTKTVISLLFLQIVIRFLAMKCDQISTIRRICLFARGFPRQCCSIIDVGFLKWHGPIFQPIKINPLSANRT